MNCNLSLLSAFILLASRPGELSAITVNVPEIPVAKLTACEALDLANKRFTKEAMAQLISIDWCQPSSFRPRVTDGAQLHFLNAPEEWSWVITFVTHGEVDGKRVSRVSAIRVRNDGSIEVPVGTRT